MIQAVMTIIAPPYHLDLLKFSESSGDGHVVWLCFKPEHGLLEQVIHPVANDKCDKLNKYLR